MKQEDSAPAGKTPETSQPSASEQGASTGSRVEGGALDAISQPDTQHKWADEPAGPSATSVKGEGEDQDADGVKEQGSKNSATDGGKSESGPNEPNSPDSSLGKEGLEEQPTLSDSSVSSEPTVKRPAITSLQLGQGLTTLANTVKEFIGDGDFPPSKDLEEAQETLEKAAKEQGEAASKEGLGGSAPVVGRNIIRFDASLSPKGRVNVVIAEIDELLGKADGDDDAVSALTSARESLVKSLS